MSRPFWIRTVLYGAAVSAYLIWQPRHSGMLRSCLLLAFAAMACGLWRFAWESRKGRVAMLCGTALALLPLALPGRAFDRAGLRERYLASMRGFEGTGYLWGGEGKRGIDCSGLPRRALRDALLGEALRGNGRAARTWLDHWWHDTSAKAMGEGYRGFTVATGVSGPLWEIDPTRVEPGDLAVTSGGSHVMVHLGDGDWIQADPGPGKVIIGRPDQAGNPWFRSTVSIHRWSVFE